MALKSNWTTLFKRKSLKLIIVTSVRIYTCSQQDSGHGKQVQLEFVSRMQCITKFYFTVSFARQYTSCSQEQGPNGLSLHLHPYFVFVSSKGLGETAHFADSQKPSLRNNAIRIIVPKIACAGPYFKGTHAVSYCLLDDPV